MNYTNYLVNLPIKDIISKEYSIENVTGKTPGILSNVLEFAHISEGVDTSKAFTEEQFLDWFDGFRTSIYLELLRREGEVDFENGNLPDKEIIWFKL